MKFFALKYLMKYFMKYFKNFVWLFFRLPHTMCSCVVIMYATVQVKQVRVRWYRLPT